MKENNTVANTGCNNAAYLTVVAREGQWGEGHTRTRHTLHRRGAHWPTSPSEPCFLSCQFSVFVYTICPALQTLSLQAHLASVILFLSLCGGFVTVLCLFRFWSEPSLTTRTRNELCSVKMLRLSLILSPNHAAGPSPLYL